MHRLHKVSNRSVTKWMTKQKIVRLLLCSREARWRPLRGLRLNHILATGRSLVTGLWGEESHGRFLSDPHNTSLYRLADHWETFALFFLTILVTAMQHCYGTARTVSEQLCHGHNRPLIFAMQGKLRVADRQDRYCRMWQCCGLSFDLEQETTSSVAN